MRSGVYEGKDIEDFAGSNPTPGQGRAPHVIVDDVWNAVQWALKQEGLD